MPEELWTEVHSIVQEVANKTIPNKRKHKKAGWLSEEPVQIVGEQREAKSKGEREGNPIKCRVSKDICKRQ